MMLLPATSAMGPHLRCPVPDSQLCTIDELIAVVARQTDYLYLRFCDGEFHSMFGTAIRGKRNADGHEWMHNTMGRDLRRVFEEAQNRYNVRIEVAPCWSEWTALKDYVLNLPESARTRMGYGRPWVNAIKTGRIFEFLNTVRSSPLPKVFIGHAEDMVIAEALGAKGIPCPHPNAYEFLDSKVAGPLDAAIADNRTIVLVSIGMASESLLWEFWQEHGIMMDFGHVPDALMGRPTRRYLREKRLAARTAERFEQWRRNNGATKD